MLSPRDKGNTEKVQVFLPKAALERLKELADQKGASVSGLIRMIVLDYLFPTK